MVSDYWLKQFAIQMDKQAEVWETEINEFGSVEEQNAWFQCAIRLRWYSTMLDEYIKYLQRQGVFTGVET